MGAFSADFEDPDYDEYLKTGAMPEPEPLPTGVGERASASLRSPDFQKPKADAPLEPGASLGEENPGLKPGANFRSPLQGERAQAPPVKVAEVPAVEEPKILHRRASSDAEEARIRARDKGIAERGLRIAESERREVLRGIDKSQPFQDEAGNWKVRRADDAGAVFEVDARQLAKTDRGTGDLYFDDELGQRTVVGQDETIAERRRILDERAQLRLDNQAETLRLQELRAQLAPVKEELAAFGKTPNQLAQVAAKLRAAGGDEAAKARLGVVEQQLAAWKKNNAGYEPARARVDELEAAINRHEAARRARDWEILALQTDPAQAARLALRPRAVGSDATLQQDASLGGNPGLKPGANVLRPAGASAAASIPAGSTLENEGRRPGLSTPAVEHPKPGLVKKLIDAGRRGWQGYRLAEAIGKRDAAATAEAVKAVGEIPESEAIKRWQSGDMAGAAFQTSALPEMFVESMTAYLPAWVTRLPKYMAIGAASGAGIGSAVGSVVPGAGTGAGALAGLKLGALRAGPALAAGMASLALEGSGKIVETLAEHGVDIDDPKALQAAFSDPKLMAEAQTLALKKGLPVAAFDALTALLPVRGLLTARGASAKIGAAMKRAGIEGAAGMAGEATGQMVAGETLSVPDIVAEGVLEGVGIGETVVGVAATKLGFWGGEKTPAATQYGAERYRTTLEAFQDTAAKLKTAETAGDAAAVARLESELDGLNGGLQELSAAFVQRVPLEVRRRLARLSDPQADFDGNEAALGADPVLHFAAAEIGSHLAVSAPTLSPRAGVAAGIAERAGVEPEVAGFIRDQHLGMAAVRDLGALLQGKAIDGPRAAVLESLGLVERDDAPLQQDASLEGGNPGLAPGANLPRPAGASAGQSATYRVTDDALPLLPKALQQRARAGDLRGRVAITAGDTGNVLNTLLRGGQNRLAALAAPTFSPARPAPGAGASRAGGRGQTAGTADAGQPGGGAGPGEESGAESETSSLQPKGPSGPSTTGRWKVSVVSSVPSGGTTTDEFSIDAPDAATAERRVRERAERAGRAVSAITVQAAQAEPGSAPTASPGAAPIESTGQAAPGKLAVNRALIAAVKRAGVKVTFAEGPSLAEPKPDGSIVVNLNPKEDLASERGASVVEEEMLHAAGLLVKAREWKAAGRAGTFRGDFRAFLNEDAESMLGELRGEWQALPAGPEREAIEQALVAGFNLYFTDHGRPSPEVATLDGVLAALRPGPGTVAAARAAGLPPVSVQAYVHELARQILQLRRDGVLSESTLRGFIRSVAQWLRAAVEALRAMAKGIGDGALAKTGLANFVRETEAEIESLSKADLEQVAEAQRPGSDSNPRTQAKPASAPTAGPGRNTTTDYERTEPNRTNREMEGGDGREGESETRPAAEGESSGAARAEVSQPGRSGDALGGGSEIGGEAQGRSAPITSPESQPEGAVSPRRGATSDGGFADDPAVAVILENGGLMSRSGARQRYGEARYREIGELWSGAPSLANPRHNKIYGGSLTPDQAAQLLIDAGLLKEGASVDQMWQAVSRASESAAQAMKMESEGRKQEKQARRFYAEALTPEKGDVPVAVSTLKVGDVVTLAGERVKVKAIDPDTFDVTLEDGAKFGVQTVEDGSVLYVEALDVAGETPAGEGAVFARRDAVGMEETLFDRPAPAAESSTPPTPEMARWRRVHAALSAQVRAGKALNGGQRALLERAEKMLGQRPLFGEETRSEAAPPKETAKATWAEGGITGGPMDFGNDLFDEKATVGRFTPGEAQGALFARMEGVTPGRFRPREKVEFSKPLVGPSGAKLTAYQWAWMPEEFIDKRGEERVRRVSDWEKAIASADTGRDLVHQFEVTTPNGKTQVVSAETVPVLLGMADRLRGTRLPSLVSATKTLASLRMKLAVAQAQHAENERIYQEVQKLPVPPIDETPQQAFPESKIEEGRAVRAFVIPGSNAWRVQHAAGPADPDTRRSLASQWREEQMARRGYQRVAASVPDLEQRIRKQERKIVDIVAQVQAEMPPVTIPAAEVQGTLFARGEEEGVFAPLGERLRALIADPARADAAYDALPEARGGKVIGTDIARGLEPHYAASREGKMLLSPLTLRPGREYAQDRLMRELRNRGARKRVLFTAGGVAAGKSRAISDRVIGMSDLVFDSTLMSPQWAMKAIDEALRNGWEVNVIYVQRPIKQAAEAVIDRAQAEGRWGSFAAMPETHRRAQSSIVKIAERFAGHPRVRVNLLHNVDMTGALPEIISLGEVVKGGRLSFSPGEDFNQPSDYESITRRSDAGSVDPGRSGSTRGPLFEWRIRGYSPGEHLRVFQAAAAAGPTSAATAAGRVEPRLLRFLAEGSWPLERIVGIVEPKDRVPPPAWGLYAREDVVAEEPPTVAKPPGQLIRENVGLAVRLARQYGNVRADERDIEQTAKQALVIAAKRFSGGNFAAYAGTVIRNALSHFYRAEKRYVESNEVTLDETRSEDADEELTPKDRVTVNAGGEEPPVSGGFALELSETQREMNAAIARLPERPRMVLQRISAGETPSDIARSLGVSQQAIAKMANNARLAVAGMLRKKGFTGVSADGVLYAREDGPLRLGGELGRQEGRKVDAAGAGGQGERMPEEPRAAQPATGQPSPSGSEARAIDEAAERAETKLTATRTARQRADVTLSEDKDREPEDRLWLTNWNAPDGDEWMKPFVNEPRIYEYEGKFYLDESPHKYGSLDEAFAAAIDEIRESVKQQGGTFGSDMDGQAAANDIFGAWPSRIPGVEQNGWFHTKWGSWYLEGGFFDEHGEADEGRRFKLSIRDHDVSRKDMGPVTRAFHVGKEWNPRDVAKALKDALDWVHKNANTADVSKGGVAGFKAKQTTSATEAAGSARLEGQSESIPPGNVNPESRALEGGALGARVEGGAAVVEGLEDIEGAGEWQPTWMALGEGADPWEPIDVSERRRWHRLPAILFESAADVLRRQKNAVAQRLSAALHDATNFLMEIEARLAAPLDVALAKIPSRRERVQAKREFAEYQTIKARDGKAEAEAALRDMSAGAQELVRATKRLFAATGSFAQRRGVKVWDQDLNEGRGGYRLIGNMGGDYWPRIVKADLTEAIENPDRHPAAIEKYSQMLRDEGWKETEIADFFKVDEKGLLKRSDFFGQLEMARREALPAGFYEYDFDRVVPAFIRGFSDRMAQIMAFGQKLAKDPNSKDLFDEATEDSRNVQTVEFVQAIKKQVYRIEERTTWNRFTASVRTLASGLLLANPFTTVPRNMISGVLANIEMGGTRRTMKALGRIIAGTVTPMTARQLGTVKANVLDAQDYNDPELTAAAGVRKFANFTLGMSGYHASERLVRTLATATAMQWVTDYLHAAADSKTAREAEAFMRRVNVEPSAVRVEDGDFKQGAATRTLVRRFVLESQFGYDSAQVPLWANSPTGRLFYQYGRWGTQRARTLWQHVFEPAIFGEELVGQDGKRYKVRRMRPLATLLGAMLTRTIQVGGGAVLTGELFALVAQMFFKRDRDDEDWEVIVEQAKTDERKAAVAAAERLVNDVMLGGMLGILSQPVDLARSWVQGSRFKNPIEPPASAVPRASYELARSWYERGMPGSVDDARAGMGQDLWMALRTVMPGTGAAADTVGRMGAIVTSGTGWFDSAQAQRTLANLRKASRRFAVQYGLEAGGKIEGRFGKTPRTAAYDRLQDALLTGDVKAAQRVIDEYEKRFAATGDYLADKKAMDALQDTVRGRQPVKVGSHTSDEVQEAFIDWARTHLSPERQAEILQVQATYEMTAQALGLMR